MEKPYTDIEVGENYVIREFDQNIDPIELLWHRDDEDREVTILECGEGWGFQLEDQLPLTLQPGTSIFIYRHDWHRVIKGEGRLLLRINKK